MGLFDKLRQGLSKTRAGLGGRIDTIFSAGKIDEETLEELEETLIASDVGVNASLEIVEHLRKEGESITGVKTVYNNDQDNSSGLGAGKDRPYIETNLGRLIDAKGAKGRYVRLYSNGNTLMDTNHYVEVEVYGKPT